jgi:hypothetical protein
MATTFKRLTSADIAVTKLPVYESIPIPASILNTTAFTKEMTEQGFLRVYDFTNTDPSANHILDVAAASKITSPSTDNGKKLNNAHNLFSQVLLGYKPNSEINSFPDNDLYFISLSRLIGKDEVKEGSLSLVLSDVTAYNGTIDQSGHYYTAGFKTIVEKPNATKTQGNAGWYKELVFSDAQNTVIGYLFYQAGMIALKKSIFTNTTQMGGTSVTNAAAFTTQTPIYWCKALLNRIDSISVQNTTQVNSTIYFCNINHNEFNYSSNRTYTDSSTKILVKNEAEDPAVSYITTVGLYSPDNELLAVAKLSQPIKKTNGDSLILRVRLDV